MFAQEGKKSHDMTDDFFVDMLNFYKTYIQQTSETVKMLSGLQKKYKKSYQEFVEFQKNPASIMEMAKDQTEAGTILFFILARIAFLSSKIMHLYELDTNEQEKLSEELKQFITEIDSSIEKLKMLKGVK